MTQETERQRQDAKSAKKRQAGKADALPMGKPATKKPLVFIGAIGVGVYATIKWEALRRRPGVEFVYCADGFEITRRQRSTADDSLPALRL
jgi:hypothetical protein